MTEEEFDRLMTDAAGAEFFGMAACDNPFRWYQRRRDAHGWEDVNARFADEIRLLATHFGLIPEDAEFLKAWVAQRLNMTGETGGRP